MLSSNSLPVFSLFSVLLALPLASAAPAYRRDLSYDQVRDAVIALPTGIRGQGVPGSGSNLAVDNGQAEPAGNAVMVGTAEYRPETLYTPEATPSATGVFAGAQLLAADGECDEGGYWQIYTTSRWIGGSRSGA